MKEWNASVGFAHNSTLMLSSSHSGNMIQTDGISMPFLFSLCYMSNWKYMNLSQGSL